MSKHGVGMAILPSTKEIIERTEKLTGKPVLITEDRSLQVISRIEIARGPAPMHILRYKPLSGCQHALKTVLF